VKVKILIIAAAYYGDDTALINRWSFGRHQSSTDGLPANLTNVSILSVDERKTTLESLLGEVVSRLL